ncbi:hypothetical protein [Xenorhabdus nematophila]|uniref:hypothetical protein n=1 Tax=Xenorhabdus nematophila TaxID=628 RepID=UPI0030D78512
MNISSIEHLSRFLIAFIVPVVCAETPLPFRRITASARHRLRKTASLQRQNPG